MTKYVGKIPVLKFQAIAEKTAKNFRGLLFFASPCRQMFAGKFLHTFTASCLLLASE